MLLFFSSKKYSISAPYWGENSVMYQKQNRYIIFRFTVYNKLHSRTSCPILIIDIENNKFSFIEWSHTSLYYTFDTSQDTFLVANLSSFNEIPGPEQIIFYFHVCHWFEMKDLEKIEKLYSYTSEL